MSKKHSNAEDDDYMKSVFDEYSKAAKDKKGNPTGVDILSKDATRDASSDII